LAEKQGAFRTTISVPGDLKMRMDRVNEPVNWSALACRAFEDKLGEIAARSENKTMIDVIERLRASLRDEQGQSFKEGYEIGKNWARDRATAAQLRRLESFQETTKARSIREWENWFCPPGMHKPWLELVKIIEDIKNHRNPAFAIAFWNTLVAEGSPQPNDGEFLRGFVDGAVDLWSQVQGHL
jgi:hypothetical protein